MDSCGGLGGRALTMPALPAADIEAAVRYAKAEKGSLDAPRLQAGLCNLRRMVRATERKRTPCELRDCGLSGMGGRAFTSFNHRSARCCHPLCSQAGRAGRAT